MIKQKANCNGYEPLVIMKKNHKKPLVVLDAEHFIELIKGLTNSLRPSIILKNKTKTMAQELTEQQQHLKNLVEQAQSLDASITQQRNLLLRCQGAIEYLQQTGVTLPAPEPEEEVAGVEPADLKFLSSNDLTTECR